MFTRWKRFADSKDTREKERERKRKENKYRSRNLFLTTMGRDGGPYIALQLNRYAIAMSWDLVFPIILENRYLLTYLMCITSLELNIFYILYIFYILHIYPIFRFIFICTIKYNLVYKIISNSLIYDAYAHARAHARISYVGARIVRYDKSLIEQRYCKRSTVPAGVGGQRWLSTY